MRKINTHIFKNKSGHTTQRKLTDFFSNNFKIYYKLIEDCLLLFSYKFVSDSLQPHGLQHTRLPYPSLSPRVCSNGLMSIELGCQPTISSSVIPFSFCPQFFPASESFPMSWLFPSFG